MLCLYPLCRGKTIKNAFFDVSYFITFATFRTFYTQRILSIVANVKKQNEEMHRVLEDVKSVQREINSLEGKVERTFTVTDEMIFKVANHNTKFTYIHLNQLQI